MWIVLGGLWGNLHAEIVTDGSLGTSVAQTLAAPNYIIGESLGLRQGNNLFHSFSRFNVLQGETATFQADANVGNILARVAGNELSSINGTISTGQSAANLWLINPNGWLLGSHARFDIHGALHITTANAVGFGQGDKFYADPKQSSQLSVAAPLTLELDKPSQAAITIDQADLQLPAYRMASFTAPKLNVSQTAISVPGGRIVLGGLSPGVWTLDAQQGLEGRQPANGDITFTGHYADADGVTKPITTSLVQNGIAATNAIDGGRVQLSANAINLHDAVIAQSAVSGRQSGSIDINANLLRLDNGTNVNTDVVESGDAGGITIQAGDLLLSDGAVVSSNSQFNSNGNAGHIVVAIKNELNMTGNSSIASYNNGSGLGGAIDLSANRINLDNDAAVAVNSNDRGNAGRLSITANSLNLTQGGTIDSSTLTQGQGGNINIQAQHISMADQETFITSSAFGEGQGGSVNIQSEYLSVARQAQIRTLSEGTGNAGNIELNVNGQFRLDNAQVTTQALQSDGGPININANTVFLRHGQITTSVEGPLGDGGNITMTANNLVMDGGFIQANTAAENAFGGDIRVDAKRLIAGGSEVLVGGKRRLQYDPGSRLNVIQAAAEHGVAGNVRVNTVELNVAGQLLPLDSRFITQPNISDNPCLVLRGQRLSSLIAVGQGGLPATAVDMMSTHLDHYLTPADLPSFSSNSSSSSALSCPESRL